MIQKHEIFIHKLRDALSGDLPGIEAQMKMVPAIRRVEMQKRNWDRQARKAAVLIAIYQENGELRIPLIRRNEYDGVHSGQISLPGGKMEETDADLIRTALREAKEETNISVDELQVLGSITNIYIPPSNFIVQPVVAWLDKKPDFIAQESEVAEIITISLAQLLNPVHRLTRNISHREYRIIDVPCFYIDENIIWGATAMILSELADVIDSI